MSKKKALTVGGITEKEKSVWTGPQIILVAIVILISMSCLLPFIKKVEMCHTSPSFL